MTRPLVAEAVRVRVLEAAIDADVPMSFSSLRARRSCLVEVEAGGVTGIGESWLNYPAWAVPERVATICDGIAEHVLGTDVSHPPAVQQRLAATLGPIGRQAGAPGPIWQGISGIDLALWDLVGRAAGQPTSMLCADGQRRSSIPAYGSGVGPTDVHALCEQALAAGLDAVKIKVGFGRERDERTLADTRDVCGPDVHLFADANQAWDLAEAAEMCRLLADHGVEWVEEPLAGNDLGQLEKLATVARMPLATGENLYGLDEFGRYVASPAISQIQPDVAKTGGLTTALEVARQAAGAGTRVSPHWYGGAIGIAASLQLGAASPAVEWIELDVRPNPLRTALGARPFTLDRGRLVVPPGPGLGIELDPAVVRQFQVLDEERRVPGG